MSRSIALLVAVLISVWAAPLPAQDFALGQKYGRGVHAYFAGDYVNAYEQLTASITAGSKDPRAYYFRGLAYLNLGRAQEASMDFQKGAELEGQDVNRLYNVAKALERVQGKARLALENYRVEARMAALEEAEKMRKARYAAIEQEEARVVRETSILPAEAAMPPQPAAKSTVDGGAAPAASTETDPFATPDEKSAAKPDTGKKPAKADKKAAKSEELPAGEVTAEKKTEKTSATAAKTIDQPKPAEKAAADADDPFATPDAATPPKADAAAKPAAAAAGAKAATSTNGKAAGTAGKPAKAAAKAAGNAAAAKADGADAK
jgi:hypothetical protein